MKRMTKLALVSGAAATAIFGSSVYAFAGWIVDVPPTTVKVRAAAMPAGNAPSVARSGKNAAIDWVGNKIVAGVQVESYIVTRFGTGTSVVVCERVTTTACKDKLVPAGTWTWKVRPVFRTWVGDLSPESVALTFTETPPVTDPIIAPSAPLVATPEASEDVPVAGGPPRIDDGSPAPTPSPTPDGPGPSPTGPVLPPSVLPDTYSDPADQDEEAPPGAFG